MAIHLLTGDDPSVVRAAVHDLVHELVGDGDRSLVVDEFDDDEYELRTVVDAAQTPPFLTEKRVVVARGIGRFTADDVAPLLGYLDEPLPTTDLVLVGGGGQIPKKLRDAVGSAGGTVTNTTPPSGKGRQAWVDEQAVAHGVRLHPAAAAAIGAWLGEEVGRLDGILATLASTFGGDQVLSRTDVEPFLGDAGGVPPWDLTDAIDRGDTSTALDLLGRMLHGGERHPLQVMAVLHGHYARLARLDGHDVRDQAQAAELMGIKPGFPAKKALANHRRLGGEGVARAIGLLATADLDLRGERDLPPELVMDVLVARLSRLSRRR